MEVWVITIVINRVGGGWRCVEERLSSLVFGRVGDKMNLVNNNESLHCDVARSNLFNCDELLSRNISGNTFICNKFEKLSFP
jgi:hypothetical protein